MEKSIEDKGKEIPEEEIECFEKIQENPEEEMESFEDIEIIKEVNKKNDIANEEDIEIIYDSRNEKMDISNEAIESTKEIPNVEMDDTIEYLMENEFSEDKNDQKPNIKDGTSALIEMKSIPDFSEMETPDLDMMKSQDFKSLDINNFSEVDFNDQYTNLKDIEGDMHINEDCELPEDLKDFDFKDIVEGDMHINKDNELPEDLMEVDLKYIGEGDICYELPEDLSKSVQNAGDKSADNINTEVTDKLLEKKEDKSKNVLKKNGNKKTTKTYNPKELEKKVKEYSYVVGVLAFSFNTNPLKGIKSFTLANFSKIVINEPCNDKNWLDKIQFFVNDLKITNLYVQGYVQAHFLRDNLNIYIQRLPKRNNFHCKKCGKRSCGVGKVKHFFQTFFDYKIPVTC